MPIWHWRLFFRPDKVSCLVVVFLVLAALSPRCPSSAYLNKMDAVLDGEWCFFYFCTMFLHLSYSRLADAPPPAHQTTTMTRRQRQNTRQRQRLAQRVNSF